ncbi:MAG: DNA helicase UvrD [Candidatus Terrybacteria bacterium RIFCSPHIGHO2_01_FULL_48_17]|uniref:DNA helicase UvrD n=1 Tax=Candidatus Terrybacteria bacterium RIFCSPHIGHO2_01_FULL_48_17 TaxID=1802362 RepID=A0A1G2PKX0_9BACT|nr:MAG: DNA helicase UvrD [Candidatus Terrybacteria bacterium RIFCSPHIGHO2_01_FULL_48_17]OHA53765.1 MAG: DNA helicase UvrD [Candidatus Terrybacteria bacterium RIFCSPLOWO2_01_FULL_48_14]
MRWFGDFHIHSRFSRATSKELTLPVLDEWARKKGIAVMGTGDFTHPQWISELKEQLEPSPEKGLFWLRNDKIQNPKSKTRFLLTVEISSIYSKAGRVRKVHTILFAPSFEAAEAINARLSWTGNLASDGRPIIGMDAKEVAKIAFKSSPDCMVIPAHAWTPWFSIFGSMSGFDSIEECFEELAPNILAIETGLSSDPSMNWRVSALDNVALMSNSDSHSARKIGREVNVLDGAMSYPAIVDAFRTGAPVRAGEREKAACKLLGTIEFFPEEGKYHYDGHRLCKVRWTPAQTRENSGKCTVCGRPVTVGVLSRVDDLADRPEGQKPEGAPHFRSLVPLEEIIADVVGVGTGTKSVEGSYNTLVSAFGNEFSVLLDAPIEQIAKESTSQIAEGIRRVRERKLYIEPGYDGEFGKVKIFGEEERESIGKQGSGDKEQDSLF